MQRQHSRKSNKNFHQRSLDDFLKKIRKCNLRSERHLSPKPMYYMYNNRRTHTLERSRTLSNKQSITKKTITKSTRKRVEKILDGEGKSSRRSRTQKSDNPADKISLFSMRIKQVEKYLEGKSKIGILLCQRFMDMMNDIVESMVENLQQNIRNLEVNIFEKLEKEIKQQAENKMDKMKTKMMKLEKTTLKLLEKQNYNNNLLYYLRLQNCDVDKEFGRCIFGSDNFGGRGYNLKNGGQTIEINQNISNEERIENIQQFQNDEISGFQFQAFDRDKNKINNIEIQRRHSRQ